jgi:ribosomal protein S18 acetylase RimI-like enzyme
MSTQFTETLVSCVLTLINSEARNSLMLSKTFEQIDEMLRRERGFAVLHEGAPVSFAGISEWQNYWEIGGLVTSPAFRRHGFGTSALIQATMQAQRLPKKPIIALANATSAKMLEKIGFVKKPQDWFDDEVWLDCKNCLECDKRPDCHCVSMTLDGKLIALPTAQIAVMRDLTVEKVDDLVKTAEMYCRIWGEAPWFEDFWTTDGVINDFLEALAKPGAIFKTILIDGEVAGLCLCYQMEYEEAIGRNPELGGFYKNGEPVFYIDELAVSSKFRHQKIGETLTRAILKENPNCHFTLRTHIDAIPARSLYRKIGFTDLGWPDSTHSDRTYWHINTPSSFYPIPCRR